MVYGRLREARVGRVAPDRRGPSRRGHCGEPARAPLPVFATRGGARRQDRGQSFARRLIGPKIAAPAGEPVRAPTPPGGPAGPVSVRGTYVSSLTQRRP